MTIIAHFFCDPQTDKNICIEILKIIKQIFAKIPSFVHIQIIEPRAIQFIQ